MGNETVPLATFGSGVVVQSLTDADFYTTVSQIQTVSKSEIKHSCCGKNPGNHQN